MDPKYAHAFVNATQRICSEVLGLSTRVETPRLVQSHAPHHYITGVIKLRGDRECTVSLGFDRMVAVRATEFLVGERPTCINAQVVDAVAEVTNQIVGVARRNLHPLSMTVSIPYVISGISQSIAFPLGCQRISFPMTSLWGNLAIDFGFSPVLCSPDPSENPQESTPATTDGEAPEHKPELAEESEETPQDPTDDAALVECDSTSQAAEEPDLVQT